MVLNKYAGSLLLVFLLGSCFYKSNKTGSADDVVQSFTCHTANGDFLVTHEEVFHANSKSSGPTGTYISGTADYRYTVRNLQTGEQVARVVTGDRDEDVYPVGYDGKQLWCYGAERSSGLHAREPAGMQVTITQEDIENANPNLRGNINHPKIYETPQFFVFDPLANQVMLTDLQGNLYNLDPSTLKAVPVRTKPMFDSRFDHASSGSANRWPDMNISMSGDNRKQIDFQRGTKSEESYLKGEILLEQNTMRLNKIAKQVLETYDQVVSSVKAAMDSLLNIYPALNDERQAYLTIKDYHIPSKYASLKRQLESAQRDTMYSKYNFIRDMDNMVLGCDSNCLYIMHANNLTDTSSILLTKTIIKNGVSTPQWTTMIPGIYFDPSKGISRNPRSDVFKAGNPQFRYEWFGLEGKILTGIRMLHAFGIDDTNGKVLWVRQL